jgi:hypothetical protein
MSPPQLNVYVGPRSANLIPKPDEPVERDYSPDEDCDKQHDQHGAKHFHPLLRGEPKTSDRANV